jgi:hypothetical protein
MFETNVVEEFKTHISCSKPFFENYAALDNVERYNRAGQATDENMAHADCMLDT